MTVQSVHSGQLPCGQLPPAAATAAAAATTTITPVQTKIHMPHNRYGRKWNIIVVVTLVCNYVRNKCNICTSLFYRFLVYWLAIKFATCNFFSCNIDAHSVAKDLLWNCLPNAFCIASVHTNIIQLYICLYKLYKCNYSKLNAFLNLYTSGTPKLLVFGLPVCEHHCSQCFLYNSKVLQ